MCVIDVHREGPCISSQLLLSCVQAGFQNDAYYGLVDVWRKDSPKVGSALRAYHQHVASRKAKPDWKGFMIGIFGINEYTPAAKPKKYDAHADKAGKK